LIAGAIGESGGITGTLPAIALSQAEKAGADFASGLNATSLAALRALDSQQILEPATKGGFASIGRFPISIDGYFFPEDPASIYAAGKQAHVPLLVGWNTEEMTWRFLMSGREPTRENYEARVSELYGARADEALKMYSASTREEVIDVATDLAGDRFIAYSTWKWAELHGKTGGKPVYRYLYARVRPAIKAGTANAMPPARGAVHSAEIEYAMGNLSSNTTYAWTPDDYKVSKVMQEYFANFIKKGDPNGKDLPSWPVANHSSGAADTPRIMRIDVDSRAEPDKNRPRYLFLDTFVAKP